MRTTLEIKDNRIEDEISTLTKILMITKNEAINLLLQSLYEQENNFMLEIGGEKTSLLELKESYIDIGSVIPFTKMSTAFKNNFYKNLPVRYRSVLCQFFLLLKEKSNYFVSKGYNFNEFHIGTAKNLNAYGNDQTRLFYMNITGKVGRELVSDYLERLKRKFHPSSDDPNSMIWISRYEKFINEGEPYQDSSNKNFYNYLLDKLGIDTRNISVQLSVDDIQQLNRHLNNL